MKFHNQRSFMGHEISNVNNKPLLHKKGKQWIVVAVSALILAGFGGMVSTTTHADTTNAQPTTTKVAPKPANTPANVMKQAQGMHKALTNNAAVQKPSAPSSVAAKKTAPASAASTNSASSKSSSASSNSNSSNNKANKPTVHMMLMSTPVSTLEDSTPRDPIKASGSLVSTGKWGNANYSIYHNDNNDYQLDLYGGQLESNNNPFSDATQKKITSIKTNYNDPVKAPVDSTALFAANNNWGRNFNNLKSIDLSGLNTSATTNMASMFHGDGSLQHIYFKNQNNQSQFTTSNVTNMDSMFDDDWQIQSLDMSNFDTSKVTDFGSMFWNTPSLLSLDISKFNMTRANNVGSMFTMNQYGVPNEPGGGNASHQNDPRRVPHLEELVLPNDGYDWTKTGLSNNNIDIKGSNVLDSTNLSNGQTVQNNNGYEQLEEVGTNGQLDPSTETSSWSQVASHPGTWVNKNAKQEYKVQFYDVFSDSNVQAPQLSNETVSGIPGTGFVSFNGTVPTGYILANFSNSETTNKINSSTNTATIDVIHNVWGSAHWTLDNQGNLTVSNGTLDNNANKGNETNLYSELHMPASDAKKVKTLSFGTKVTAPSAGGRLFDDEANHYFSSLSQIDLRNLDLSSIQDPWAMFGGLQGLTNVIGLNHLPQNGFDGSWLFVNDPNLKSVDLSNTPYINNTSNIFNLDNNLQVITLGPKNTINKYAFITGNGENTLPNNQETWTNLKGQTVNLDNGGTLTSDNTWNAGNHPLTVTDKLIYKNIENNHLVSSNNDYHDVNNKDTSDGYITGYYGSSSNVINWSEFGNQQSSNINNNVPFNWGVVTDSKRNGNDLNFTLDNGPHYIYIQPNQQTISINYKYDNKNVGQGTTSVDVPNASGAIHQDLTIGAEPNGLPNGYYVNDASQHFTPQELGNTNYAINIQVTPIKKTDIINYINSEKTVSSVKPQGNDYQANKASDTTFISNVPNGYHTMSDIRTHTFNYDGNTHNVNVYPNTVTVTYKNGSQKVGNATATFNGTPISDDFKMPSGYELNQDNNKLQFNQPNSSVNVSVKPIYNTDTVNYKYNSNLVSSTKDNGADISTFNANNKVPAGYYATGNTIFKYDGGNHTVNVSPNQDTDTVNYQYNGKTLATYHSSGNDYRATSAGNNSVDITSANEPNIPSDYHLVNSDNKVPFDNKTHDVAITPVQKSDAVNYMNNDLNIASDVYTGNDMYANGASDTAFNANTKIPAGYHVASDGGNTFEFDGQKHDVTVYPNSLTIKFNNGNLGSYKVSGLKGSTYKLTNNILPKYYQLANSDSDVIDLGSLGKDIDYNVNVVPSNVTDVINYMNGDQKVSSAKVTGAYTTKVPSADVSNKVPSNYQLTSSLKPMMFDNGSYNVAVQPIPQSAPYIPSMPVSSAASTSSASSAVATPSSVASQTSVASSASTSVTHHYYHSHYSHYRYAKVITPLQLHTSKHFTDKNGVLTIKNPTEFRIMRIVRDHKYARYEVRYNNKRYFITANPKFTINDYVQKSDFKNRKHMMVRVITPLIEYRRLHFGNKYIVRNVRKGTVLPVKKVITIGKGEMTRFELTNGRFVTSNKLFVKVIK